MGQSPNPDWMNQWQDLSRNYLTAWQTMSRGAEAPAPTPPWQEGFESWSRLFAGGGAQNETIDRIIDSAKGYAAFMQSLLAAGSAGHAAAAPWSNWLRPGAGIPGMDATAFDNPMLRAMRDLQGQNGGAFAQMMSTLGELKLPAAGAFSAPGDLGDLKAWLNLPAFGVMREQQEHRQKTVVAWIEYQEQMGRYNALMLKATQRGFQLFEGKLSEREQPGRQIESLRALYDLWVDAAEEGYAEVALSPEFREVYGAMVNAQMRVRAQIQHEVERVAVDFGMPTRSEVDSIGERLQALRREVRERGEARADKELAREVARLRSELTALKASLEPARETAPPVARSRTHANAKPVAKARTEASAPTKAASIEPVHASVTSTAAPTKRKAASKKRRDERKSKPERAAKRAVAAKASSTFASRIAEFADASLGQSRTPRLKKKAKSGKSKKKNRA